MHDKSMIWLPHTWLRFLDDIFFIWTEDSNKRNLFVDYLNNLHSTIKFTCSHSLTNVAFLDVMVSLKDGLVETDRYTKPTEKHQYLLISSKVFAYIFMPSHPYYIALHFAFDA